MLRLDTLEKQKALERQQEQNTFGILEKKESLHRRLGRCYADIIYIIAHVY